MPRIEFSNDFTVEEKGIFSATVASNIEVLNIGEGYDFTVSVKKTELPNKDLYGYLTPAAEDDFFGGDERSFDIFLNKLNGLHRNIETLSHEMIHVEQHLTKRLQADFDGLYWLGKFVPGYIVTDMRYYSMLPWENEAHKWDGRLYRIAVKKLNMKEENDDN